jgi:hypothetical protein
MPSKLNVAKKVFKRKLKQFKRGDCNKKPKKSDEVQLFDKDSTILEPRGENPQESGDYEPEEPKTVKTVSSLRILKFYI